MEHFWPGCIQLLSNTLWSSFSSFSFLVLLAKMIVKFKINLKNEIRLNLVLPCSELINLSHQIFEKFRHFEKFAKFGDLFTVTHV